MRIGKVIGQIVATVKDPGLSGMRMFVVQGLNEKLEAVGAPFAAVDGINCAGPGDLVHLVFKRDAAIALGDKAPVDATIVGFVDQVAAEQSPGGPVLTRK